MKKDTLKARGFYRLQIVEEDNGTPKVVGDSGWHENQITNDGFDQYLVKALGSISGSKYISHAAIGTGTVPGAAATSLDGEITDAAGARCAVSASAVNSKTLQLTFTFNSGIVTAAKTIQNVGLFNTSATNAGTLFAGNTYATSSLATNQIINGTYQVTFS